MTADVFNLQRRLDSCKRHTVQYAKGQLDAYQLTQHRAKITKLLSSCRASASCDGNVTNLLDLWVTNLGHQFSLKSCKSTHIAQQCCTYMTTRDWQRCLLTGPGNGSLPATWATAIEKQPTDAVAVQDLMIFVVWLCKKNVFFFPSESIQYSKKRLGV